MRVNKKRISSFSMQFGSVKKPSEDTQNIKPYIVKPIKKKIKRRKFNRKSILFD